MSGLGSISIFLHEIDVLTSRHTFKTNGRQGADVHMNHVPWWKRSRSTEDERTIFDPILEGLIDFSVGLMNQPKLLGVKSRFLCM